MKIILFSGCDDGYAPLLLDMMESLGDRLQEHDFGLLDLGLSEDNIAEIRKLKPDAIIKKPQWFLDFPEYRKNVFSQACSSRPFIKEIFPDYGGYMHLDADLWLTSPSVVDDYIKAAEKTGFSITTETHDTLNTTFYKIRFIKLFGKYIKRGIFSRTYKSLYSLFGSEDAIKYGVKPRINAGLYFIHADSPVWEKWQESMKSVKWHKISKEQSTCDQTCLLHALYKYDLPHTLLSFYYNWCLNIKCNKPLLDTKTGKLLDTTFPYAEIKVIHLTNNSAKDVFTLSTTDEKTVKTKLTRKDFLKSIA